jgi:N-carbamoylputrescine amidase
MRIALAALGFINKDINYNKMVIIDTLNNLKNKVDIVLFGEAFLQGFDSLSFDYGEDKYIPLSIYSNVIREIIEAAKENKIAVSFGFIENEDNKVYSSQLTIDSEGNIVNLYRRVSKGWKETYATEEYCEGSSFSSFSFMGKRIVVGLCGDLWYEENIKAIQELNPNIVF